MNEIQELNVELPKIKLWNGKRVVTFKDIDEVHQRAKGTASRNFKANKKHFIENIDYFLITREDFNGRNSSNDENVNIGNIPPKGLTLITESGYLMIVKSFTDDLSWSVQRQLVNGYFKVQEQPQPQLPNDDGTERIFASWGSPILLPPPPKETWYERNKTKIKGICGYYGWNRKFLYHKILTELGTMFDLNEAKRTYVRENGFVPYYATDIIEYFPQLQEQADRYINYLLEE